ncbi:hypothetical protein ACLOJK_030150 [Asimina triloba]
MKSPTPHPCHVTVTDGEASKAPPHPPRPPAYSNRWQLAGKPHGTTNVRSKQNPYGQRGGLALASGHSHGTRGTHPGNNSSRPAGDSPKTHDRCRIFLLHVPIWAVILTSIWVRLPERTVGLCFCDIRKGRARRSARIGVHVCAPTSVADGLSHVR